MMEIMNRAANRSEQHRENEEMTNDDEENAKLYECSERLEMVMALDKADEICHTQRDGNQTAGIGAMCHTLIDGNQTAGMRRRRCQSQMTKLDGENLPASSTKKSNINQIYSSENIQLKVKASISNIFANNEIFSQNNPEFNPNLSNPEATQSCDMKRVRTPERKKLTAGRQRDRKVKVRDNQPKLSGRTLERIRCDKRKRKLTLEPDHNDNPHGTKQTKIEKYFTKTAGNFLVKS